MTITLDTEIATTRFDAAAQTCFYTIERNGRRWTVGIPLVDLDRHGANLEARKNHVANLLMQAMAGKADGEE